MPDRLHVDRIAMRSITMADILEIADV